MTIFLLISARVKESGIQSFHHQSPLSRGGRWFFCHLISDHIPTNLGKSQRVMVICTSWQILGSILWIGFNYSRWPGAEKTPIHKWPILLIYSQSLESHWLCVDGWPIQVCKSLKNTRRGSPFVNISAGWLAPSIFTSNQSWYLSWVCLYDTCMPPVQIDTRIVILSYGFWARALLPVCELLQETANVDTFKSALRNSIEFWFSSADGCHWHRLFFDAMISYIC